MRSVVFLISILVLSQFVYAVPALKWEDLQKNIDSWLAGPVSLIATPQEKEIFRRLQTPAEKMQFIKIFWARRDPILRTRENEFKQEFYSRVEYANQNFAEGNVPGWNTARGQVYIIFGPPSRVDPQVVAESTRPALLWVYDRIPSREIPANEALMFIFRDFKYVLAPPNPQQGDTIGEAQRSVDSSFRYQTIPSMVQRAFMEVADATVVDERKNYKQLLTSVETTEKFALSGIEFEAHTLQTDPLRMQVRIPVKDAPVYDEGNRIFAELYFKQDLKKADRVLASNQHVASFSWDPKTFEQLKEIVVDLPALEHVPAGEYELALTVQDRISNISETRKFPVTIP
jgi:GWxTD domain-containing protein